MSIIFKSLKKLKTQSENGNVKIEDMQIKRNVYTYGKIFSSPLVVLLIAVVVFVVVYSVYTVSTYWEKPVKEMTKDTTTVEYIANNEQVRVDAADEPASGRGITSSSRRVRVKDQKPDTVKISQEMPDGKPQMSTQENSDVIPGPSRDARYLPPPVLNDEHENDVFPSVDIPELAEKSEKKIAEKKAKENDIHRKKMDKIYKISRMIENIRTSMEQGDSEKTEKLLNRLSALKGKDDIFVLKLKAFWNMRNGDDDTASLLLKKVLIKNEKDIEAGLNMAVLDIKADRMEQAHKRLAALREIYPDNTQIPEIMRKIK